MPESRVTEPCGQAPGGLSVDSQSRAWPPPRGSAFESLVSDSGGQMTMVAWRAATEDRSDARKAVHTNSNSSLESVVTTAFNVDAQPATGGASVKTGVILVLGLLLAVTFALAGVTFFALAIAFPAVLAVADTYSVYISASDLALATQLGSIWPVYVVASIGFSVASLATIVKLIQHIDRSPAA
jgi:hypothetical protein